MTKVMPQAWNMRESLKRRHELGCATQAILRAGASSSPFHLEVCEADSSEFQPSEDQ